eukprot:CAMPEP_0196596334 /NCGR_PEP_ID=MMETSP1081-20130531/85529_1 /TAXON_ID=36882 /ORGANISM="Pyramimonas amylifera, Strain CCMP720" /LENGTH=131 /DNA_ID=CAMNT_0041921291 /DNA_START=78 /DNA_END=470 /DNA_ORIENTATION=-
MIDTAVGVVRKQGVRGLYRGLSGSVATSTPSSALFFTAYEAAKQSLKGSVPERLQWSVPMMAAALANVVASGVRVPPEVVKQRMQTGMYTGGFITSAVRLFREEGPRGMYTGYWIQLLRDVPYAALQFVTY